MSEIKPRRMDGIKANRLENMVYPNIARWMNENNLTLVAVEKMTGFTKGTVQRYFSGRNDATITFIYNFLEAPGMTFEEAFGERRRG